MADPVTATLIAGAVIGAGGAVYSGVTAYQSGKAQNKEAKAAALRAEAEGQNKARLIRGQSRRMAASQRARFASAGVDISGSAVDLQLDSAFQYEADALASIFQGNQQGADLRTQGSFAYTAGRNALISSGFNATGSILGGAGQSMAYSKTNPSFTSSNVTASGGSGGGFSTGPRSNLGVR